MHIIVASTNPVKIDCTRLGFERVFPDLTLDVRGVSVPSGVSDQPMSDAETLQGAENRARNARAAEPDADYWVGIEGGLHEQNELLLAFAWIVAMGDDDRVGRSRTSSFVLPDELVALIRDGYELGHADDKLFGRENSKHENGAIGILTHDLITRTDFYTEAMIMALIPFVNPKLTF